MSTQINQNILKNFIINNLGINKLTQKEALKYDVDRKEFKEIDTDENNYATLNEVLDDDKLYEQFATMYVEYRDNKANEKDAEKEKEEEIKVKDKNEAGV